MFLSLTVSSPLCVLWQRGVTGLTARKLGGAVMRGPHARIDLELAAPGRLVVEVENAGQAPVAVDHLVHVVEPIVYRDTVLRMAPLRPKDAAYMIKGLKAHQLLEGYRGAEPVNVEKLIHLLITFSELVMQIEPYIESIDLNPVMCTADKCVVVDARIILKR